MRTRSRRPDVDQEKKVGEPPEATGWLTAEQASDRLRVRRQTLYAYVSRGRLRMTPDQGDRRCSLYGLTDVERLAQGVRAVRRLTTADPSGVASRFVHPTT